tara:strand:+ start:595 stop:801 length:207 start_codon:yes stop_codon:yes gene_type:complete
MKLPMPDEIYSFLKELQKTQIIENADRSNLKKDSDIEVGVGRVILRSPNGTRYYLSVSNSGTITAVAV